MEKIIKPQNGYVFLGISVVLVGVAVYCFTQLQFNPLVYFVPAIASMLAAIFIWKGLIIVQPNYATVLNFFGKYSGTVRENGLFFVNPFYSRIKVSQRALNLSTQTLKVNDKMGNPIEIAAVVVWQVKDTYKAVYDVDNYSVYVKIQSEAALRILANGFAYDNIEDEQATITLRDGGDKVNELLDSELNARLASAGIHVKEARISHLAYSQEIAGAMLQRQQATAIVAARYKIVEGAVGRWH